MIIAGAACRHCKEDVWNPEVLFPATTAVFFAPIFIPFFIGIKAYDLFASQGSEDEEE